MPTKPLALALLVSLSFNGLFGYLSYKFHSDKAVAVSQLEQSIVANNALKISYDNQAKVCKITDDTIADYIEEKKDIVGKKELDLRELDKMGKDKSIANKATIVAKTATKEEKTDDVQTNTAGLDDKLPDSLRLLLSKSCHNSGGEACNHP